MFHKEMECIRYDYPYELKTRESNRQVMIGTVVMIICGITFIVSVMNLVIYFLNTDLVSQYH